MKKGTCIECKGEARSPVSYFCSDCLHKQAIEKAVAE